MASTWAYTRARQTQEGQRKWARTSGRPFMSPAKENLGNSLFHVCRLVSQNINNVSRLSAPSHPPTPPFTSPVYQRPWRLSKSHSRPFSPLTMCERYSRIRVRPGPCLWGVGLQCGDFPLAESQHGRGNAIRAVLRTSQGTHGPDHGPVTR